MAAAFKIGDWLVEPELDTITRDGATVRVEPKVMEVCVCLAEHAGRAVPKEQLVRRVWPDTFVTDDVLIRCISELRRVFGDDPKNPQVIETIPKRGYRLVAPVEWIGTSAPALPQATRPAAASHIADLRSACWWWLALWCFPRTALCRFECGPRLRFARSPWCRSGTSPAIPRRNLSRTS